MTNAELTTLYTPEETADLLTKALKRSKPISTGTLANWRSMRKGPKPTKLGREVRYTIESINAYIRQCTGFDRAA